MSKVLIFDNPEDFISVMESLQEEYNKRHENLNPKGELSNE